MISDRRVKIVATIGPSTQSREAIRKCIESGMNVARLNFSHGTHDLHLQVLTSIREVAQELETPVAILQDLQGPKIRVGKMKGGSLHLNRGQVVLLSPEFPLGEGHQIPVDFKGLSQAVSAGSRILLDDGLLELRVLSVDGVTVSAEVVDGGVLKDRKGMNVPGGHLPVDCMTPKDLEDLQFGLANNVDYIALSFVRQAADIRRLRELIDQKNPQIKIVAKIEMLQALEDLDEITRVSDAVMVARGDLAVEVGHSQLPGFQKRIIQLCNSLGKPVITATQMLDSMVENPRPTRAEITDVANAVLDGSDALMLSAETASGEHPFRCLQTMHEIISEVERSTASYYNLSLDSEFLTVAEAIGASACLTALKLDATAIVCLTTTGKTATQISSYRPKARLIAATHVRSVLNRLEVAWGLQTLAINPYNSSDEALAEIEDLLLKYGLAKTGDKIVLTLGMPVSDRGKTNSLRVFTIGGEGKRRLPEADLPLRFRSQPFS